MNNREFIISNAINPPTVERLGKLTMDELFHIAKGERSIKHPLKKVLINYLMELHYAKT